MYPKGRKASAIGQQNPKAENYNVDSCLLKSLIATSTIEFQQTNHQKDFLRIFLTAVCGAALLVASGCGGGSSSSVNGNYALQGALSQGGGAFLGGPLSGSGGIKGTFHVLDSSNCISSSSVVPVTGSTSGGKLTLNTAQVEAQTFQIKATISSDGSTISNGTYKVTGGCAAGQSGSITGFRVDPFTGNYSGTLTAADLAGNPTGAQVATMANLTQSSSADANGLYSVTGPVTLNSACFTGFQIATSQIFGTQFNLVLTPNGAAPSPGAPVVTINGYATVPSAAAISGSYSAANMPTLACNSNGFVSLSHP